MKISLVIPVRDEARSIERLMASISSQTRMPDEVIFVDAGSTDRTSAIIRERKPAGVNIRLISIGAAYPGIARNAGVRESANPLVAFTDAGIELDRDWLKELSSVMSDDASADVVYGEYVPRTDTFFKQCLAMAVVPPPADQGGVRIRPRFLASSLMKKLVWESVGGFPDFRAGEDRIFMERIEEDGLGTRRSSKARVIWDVPGDLKSVFRRFSSYSYHDLTAGRMKDWHLPVLRMYAAAAFFVFLGMVISPLFFLVPAAGFALRAMRKIAINRNEPYFRPAYVPFYFITVGFLIIFIDTAMFAGCVKYTLSGRRMAHDVR